MATTGNNQAQFQQIISLLGEIRGLISSGQSNNAAVDSLVRELESFRAEMRNSIQQILQNLATGSD